MAVPLLTNKTHPQNEENQYAGNGPDDDGQLCHGTGYPVACARHECEDDADGDASEACREISDATLSQVLWAACGINRPESKKITAPSAINAQDILMYVARKDGAYLYDPQSNTLKKICNDDLRDAVAANQKFAATAPVCLIMVTDLSKFGNRGQQALPMANMDAGYVSENICLVCTALGLNTVPRIGMDKAAISKALGLTEMQIPLLNNPIGWPK